MKQVKWISKQRSQAHAADGSSLRSDEQVKSTVFSGGVGHDGVLNLVVECDLEEDLGPLLVDVGHYTSEKGLSALMLHNLG